MSNFGGDAFDGATAIGDNNGPAMFATNSGNSNKKPSSPTGKSGMVAPTNGIDAAKLDWVDSSAYLNTKRPFCVKIGSKGGVRGALEELNAELKAAGLPGIISKKRPHQLIGREVNPGRFGLYEYGSQPQLLLESGKYPGLPLSNWLGCEWHGTFDMSSIFPPLATGNAKADKALQDLGLTIVQVSQNQAAVCLDPQSRVFVVAEGGFVAAAVTGAYRILGLIDQTHLKEAVRDPYSKQILGHQQIVRMPGGHVAATFIDLPSNAVAVLQNKDELYELGAGQHYLINPSVTVRGFFTKGEVQQELESDNTYTRDQVPVYLKVYLRYQLEKPLLLAIHGYATVFDALQDKVRSILTQILAHLDYSSMARSRNLAANEALADPNGHHTDHSDDAGTVFVTAVRQQATDELKVVAAEYGVLLEDLAIIDREFRGEIAKSMDRLTTRALEAQVESANLDRENANRRRKQEGDARVQELENTMKRAIAQTEAQNVIQAAQARAEATKIDAAARATATKLQAEAEAEAVRIRAMADAAIADRFAQELARNRIEVDRTKAYGSRTMFAPLEALNNGGAVGLAMLSNAQAAK